MAVCILVTLAVTEDLPVCFLLADTLPAINNLYEYFTAALEPWYNASWYSQDACQLIANSDS